MAETLDPLILDLLEWIGPSPRPYTEVMDAWKTSCPRLTVWEDANELGFIERRGGVVVLSPAGQEHLASRRG